MQTWERGNVEKGQMSLITYGMAPSAVFLHTHTHTHTFVRPYASKGNHRPDPRPEGLNRSWCNHKRWLPVSTQLHHTNISRLQKPPQPLRTWPRCAPATLRMSSARILKVLQASCEYTENLLKITVCFHLVTCRYDFCERVRGWGRKLERVNETKTFTFTTSDFYQQRLFDCVCHQWSELDREIICIYSVY